MKPNLNDELEKLRKQYAAELPQKAANVQRLVEAGIHALGKGLAPDWKGLEALVHKLAGSSGTYGFMHLSEVTRYLEDQICERTLEKLAPDAAAAHFERWLALFTDHVQLARELKTPCGPPADVVAGMRDHLNRVSNAEPARIKRSAA